MSVTGFGLWEQRWLPSPRLAYAPPMYASPCATKPSLAPTFNMGGSQVVHGLKSWHFVTKRRFRKAAPGNFLELALENPATSWKLPEPVSYARGKFQEVAEMVEVAR